MMTVSGFFFLFRVLLISLYLLEPGDGLSDNVPVLPRQKRVRIVSPPMLKVVDFDHVSPQWVFSLCYSG